MLPNDVVCRVAVFPRFLRAEIFDDAQFLSFVSIDKSKTVYVTSVFSKYLARTVEQVHKCGKGVAHFGNERLKEKNGGVIPVDKKNFYLGFYELLCGPIQGVEMEFYDVQIKWRPENACDAHFQIEMIENRNKGSRRQRHNDRLVAMERFVRFLYGPTSPAFDAGSPCAELVKSLPSRNSDSL